MESIEVKNGFYARIPKDIEVCEFSSFGIRDEEFISIELVDMDENPIINKYPEYSIRYMINASDFYEILLDSRSMKDGILPSKIYLEEDSTACDPSYVIKSHENAEILDYYKSLDDIIEKNKYTTKFIPGHSYLTEDKQILLCLGGVTANGKESYVYNYGYSSNLSFRCIESPHHYDFIENIIDAITGEKIKDGNEVKCLMKYSKYVNDEICVDSVSIEDRLANNICIDDIISEKVREDKYSSHTTTEIYLEKTKEKGIDLGFTFEPSKNLAMCLSRCFYEIFTNSVKNIKGRNNDTAILINLLRVFDNSFLTAEENRNLKNSIIKYLKTGGIYFYSYLFSSRNSVEITKRKEKVFKMIDAFMELVRFDSLAEKEAVISDLREFTENLIKVELAKS